MTHAARNSLIGLAAFAALAGAATTAAAAGCNGVVNQFQWGCAVWDNNNGPQYPYYKKQTRTVPRAAVQEVKGNMVKVNGAWYPVVNSADIIAAGGGNIIASGALNLKVWDGK